MSAAVWGIVGIAGFALAGLSLIAAGCVFFALDIRGVMADLSQKRAAHAVEEIRRNNAAMGDRPFRVDRINRERGRLTDKIATGGAGGTGRTGRGRTGRTQTGQTGTGGGKPLRKQDPEPPEADVTAVLSTAAATEQLPPSKATEALGSQETAVLQDENATEVLRDTDATEVLSETGATEVLSAAGATEVLTEQEGTTVLSQEQLPPQNTAGVKPVSFRITRRVEVTHADGIGENIENKVKGE